MFTGAALITSAHLDEDGRIAFSIRSKATDLPSLPEDYGAEVPEVGVEQPPIVDVPPFSIVIFIVGSRGLSCGDRRVKLGY